jgi:NAD(P)H-hydrate epimerase
MQLIATPDQMQAFDRIAVRKYSIPSLLLMENAGRGFVDVMEARFGPVSGKRVLVFCGKGNNGGDGLVIARHLVNRGSVVRVALLCKETDVHGDARDNLDIVLKMMSADRNRIHLKEVSSVRQIPGSPKPDFIVDAIFGTGFSGAVRGMHARVMRWINAQKCTVASVDIPSGTDAMTGIVKNIAVRAQITVTMGLPKIGHYVGQGRDHSGEVSVVDISIPRVAFRAAREQSYLVRAPDVAGMLPRRPVSAHKYSVGKVFVLAGSRGLTGAPFMCVQAAMRTGAGAVILGVPRSIYGTLTRKVTEVMVTPLSETTRGSVSFSALEEIREKVRWADVVVLGPGLSRDVETQRVVRNLVTSVPKPLVIDADGLNALSSHVSLLKRRNHPTILTPHVGELGRLTGDDPKYIEAYRVNAARKAARDFGNIVVLKGAPTVTGSPEGSTYVNSTGNPGMATAGTGDVLTGVIASLLAQGMEPASAAYSGVLIHGFAGDLAAKQLGQRSIMALDLVRQLPRTLETLEN